MTFAADGSFDPQSPMARVALELWWVMLGLGAVVFAVFLYLLLRGLARQGDPDAPADEGTGTASHGRWLLLGGVAMPTIVIAAVLGLSLDAMGETLVDAPDDALQIEVIGHRWWWEVRYPDEGIVTANEIHIPTGRAVAFQLSSADVIHSFWVPQLGGKLDALPDAITTLVLTADEPGTYRGVCAEFCGLHHTTMRFLVVAHTPDEFEAWVRAQARPASQPVDALAQRGHDVFVGNDCAACHTIRGGGADGTGGPDLTHLASRATIGSTTWPNQRRHLAELIVATEDVRPGTGMPQATLSDADLEALLAYLESLR